MTASDDSLARFLREFHDVWEHASNARHLSSDGPGIVEVLTEHLGTRPQELSVVAERVERHRFADVDIAMAAVAGEDPEHRLVGVGGGDHRYHQTLGDMLNTLYGKFPVAQPDLESVPVGPEATRKVVRFGMWLFRFQGVPVAVMQRQANPRFGSDHATLEVLCADPDVVPRLLETVNRLSIERSVVRGNVVSFDGAGYGAEADGFVFHARPHVPAEDVILPPGVLDRIHGHVIAIAEHADELRRRGQHLKRGLLLYGPPGTGKTHTVRHIMSRCREHTVVLLAGQTLRFVGAATALARALQPAIVVLEDCDLVAGDRSFHDGPTPLLFTVLDAMDGLDSDADVTFLLTTNRVEQLERALAQRPGRVDLAVEIPLPDEEARRKLVRLYAAGLFGGDVVDDLARRTEGTRPRSSKSWCGVRCWRPPAGATIRPMPTCGRPVTECSPRPRV